MQSSNNFPRFVEYVKSVYSVLSKGNMINPDLLFLNLMLRKKKANAMTAPTAARENIVARVVEDTSGMTSLLVTPSTGTRPPVSDVWEQKELIMLLPFGGHFFLFRFGKL